MTKKELLDSLANWLPPAKDPSKKSTQEEYVGYVSQIGHHVFVNRQTGYWNSFSANMGGTIHELYDLIFGSGASLKRPVTEEKVDWQRPLHTAKYLRDNGQLWFEVIKYAVLDSNGNRIGKQVRPRYYPSGQRWVNGLPDDVKGGKRPLLDLPALAKDDLNYIILVEGEQCCGDLQKHLYDCRVPDVQVTTWFGGCQMALSGNVDITPLYGKKVILWPDADKDQKSFYGMLHLAEELSANGSKCRVVIPQENVKHGWDCGDAIKEGADIGELLGSAKEYTADLATLFVQEIEKATEEPIDLFMDDYLNNKWLAERLKDFTKDRLIYHFRSATWYAYDPHTGVFCKAGIPGEDDNGVARENIISQLYYGMITEEQKVIDRIINEIVLLKEMDNRSEADNDKLKGLQRLLGKVKLFFKNTGSAQKMQDVLAILKDLSGVSYDTESFNKKQTLFVCANGTVDLETGKLLLHDPKERMTLRTAHPYLDWDDTSKWSSEDLDTREFFLGFMNEISMQDSTWVEYMRRLAASFAFGKSFPSHAVYFHYGVGGNGKGVFFKVMENAFGEYMETLAETAIFPKGKQDTGNTEYSTFWWTRYLHVSDVRKGANIEYSSLKTVTGDDKLSVHVYHVGKGIPMRINFRVGVSTNERTEFDGSSNSWVRRVRQVPWDFNVPQENSQRAVEVAKRANTNSMARVFLSWSLSAAPLVWSEGSVGECARITESTSRLVHENNPVASFATECLVHGDASYDRISIKDLKARYVEWAEEAGLDDNLIRKTTASQTFKKALVSVFPELKDARNKTTRYYIGIRLREDASATESLTHADIEDKPPF